MVVGQTEENTGGFFHFLKKEVLPYFHLAFERSQNADSKELHLGTESNQPRIFEPATMILVTNKPNLAEP